MYTNISKNTFLVCENSSKYTTTDVVDINIKVPSLGDVELRYFIYCNTKYVWIENNDSFGTVYDMFPKHTLNSIIHSSHGLLEDEEEKL